MPLRRFLRDHRSFAALVIALALLMKMLVPAGYMPVVAGGTIGVALCGGSGPAVQAMPGMSHHRDTPAPAATESPCAFAGLSAPSLAAADPILATVAPAFVVTIVVRTVAARRPGLCGTRRPPPRAPPASC